MSPSTAAYCRRCAWTDAAPSSGDSPRLVRADDVGGNGDHVARTIVHRRPPRISTRGPDAAVLVREVRTPPPLGGRPHLAGSIQPSWVRRERDGRLYLPTAATPILQVDVVLPLQDPLRFHEPGYRETTATPCSRSCSGHSRLSRSVAAFAVPSATFSFCSRSRRKRCSRSVRRVRASAELRARRQGSACGLRQRTCRPRSKRLFPKRRLELVEPPLVQGSYPPKRCSRGHRAVTARTRIRGQNYPARHRHRDGRTASRASPPSRTSAAVASIVPSSGVFPLFARDIATGDNTIAPSHRRQGDSFSDTRLAPGRAPLTRRAAIVHHSPPSRPAAAPRVSPAPSRRSPALRRCRHRP